MTGSVATSVDVVEAHFRNERSIPVRARPHDVWPWLAQMGFGRAGWYSWDIVDNLGKPSARRLHPEWMIRAAGEPVPGGPISFDTPVVVPPEHLALAIRRRSLGPWTIDFVLRYRLSPCNAGTDLATVATGRIDGPLGRWFARWVLGPGDGVMVRKQLRGVRQRAERRVGAR